MKQRELGYVLATIVTDLVSPAGSGGLVGCHVKHDGLAQVGVHHHHQAPGGALCVEPRQVLSLSLAASARLPVTSDRQFRWAT